MKLFQLRVLTCNGRWMMREQAYSSQKHAEAQFRQAKLDHGDKPHRIFLYAIRTPARVQMSDWIAHFSGQDMPEIERVLLLQSVNTLEAAA